MSARNLNSPDELLKYFNEYKAQLPELEVPQSHVKLGVVHLKIKAPMTMEGFKCYLWDIGVGDIKRYIDNSEGNFNDYVPIVTRIKNEIFNNNMSKAAVGMYKENLIARQLGMTEKTDNKNENTNTHKGTIQIEVIKSDIPLASNESEIKDV